MKFLTFHVNSVNLPFITSQRLSTKEIPADSINQDCHYYLDIVTEPVPDYQMGQDRNR